MFNRSLNFNTHPILHEKIFDDDFRYDGFDVRGKLSRTELGYMSQGHNGGDVVSWLWS